MNWKKWTGGTTFWRTLPAPSLIIFLAGVFCLFGSLGFILDSRNPQETTAGQLALNVVVRSCFAVLGLFGHRLDWTVIKQPLFAGERKHYRVQEYYAIVAVTTGARRKLPY